MGGNDNVFDESHIPSEVLELCSSGFRPPTCSFNSAFDGKDPFGNSNNDGPNDDDFFSGIGIGDDGFGSNFTIPPIFSGIGIGGDDGNFTFPPFPAPSSEAAGGTPSAAAEGDGSSSSSKPPIIDALT